MSILDEDFNGSSLNAIIFRIDYRECFRIKDFTRSLDGLNDLYNLFVKSKEFEERIPPRSINSGKKKEQYRDLYVLTVKPCCIEFGLFDPDAWVNAIEFAAAIITIIQFIRTNEPRRGDGGGDNNINLNFLLILDRIIDCLNRMMQVIRGPEDSITIKDAEGKSEVKLTYQDKNDLEFNYEKIMALKKFWKS